MVEFIERDGTVLKEPKFKTVHRKGQTWYIDEDGNVLTERPDNVETQIQKRLKATMIQSMARARVAKKVKMYTASVFSQTS